MKLGKSLSVLVALTTGCAAGDISSSDSDAPSPDQPSQFSLSMFDEDELSRYSPAERAYVQGHAIAVYVYGKTLPAAVGHKGYPYRPGISSPQAAVAYDWEAVMVARSGGTDGAGGAVYNDHVACDGQSDDVCTDGTGPNPDPGGDDPLDEGDNDPFVDEDCEEFLDPAAIEARTLLVDVDSDRVLGDAGIYADEFEQGMADALYLEDLDEDTDHSEVEHIKDDVQDYGMCEHSPLVLDLDGDGIELSAVKNGVRFDLRATGQPVVTAWPQPDDALLVADWNDNGRIDDGTELFGNADGHANGFVKLAAVVDSSERGGNSDGTIDSSDALFSSLRVWRDLDRDGQSAPAELSSLADAGVASISLSYDRSFQRDEFGNTLREHGTFADAAGSSKQVIDVWFRYRSARSAKR